MPFCFGLSLFNFASYVHACFHKCKQRVAVGAEMAVHVDDVEEEAPVMTGREAQESLQAERTTSA